MAIMSEMERLSQSTLGRNSTWLKIMMHTLIASLK
jgi:hypothetical protein